MLHIVQISSARSPSIDQVVRLSGKPSVLRRIEFRVDLTAAYKNPFDPADVSLDGLVKMPDGRTASVPGFLCQPFTRSVGKSTLPIAYASDGAAQVQTFSKAEILSPAGPPEWRIRFTPTKPGPYAFTFKLRTAAGVARDVVRSLTVSKAGPSMGFVGIDPNNPRAFRTSTGQSFFPIGANMCWAGARGTRDYDDWLPRYGKAKANWGRLWLGPMWVTFGLQQPAEPGGIDLANAWRLDYVMDEAASQGIDMTLCIDSYNSLRAQNNWPEWARSPFNSVNGGPSDSPDDFWSNPRAAKLYKDKLRYLVARWGADKNVFSWEFWNEVDGISDYRPAPVLAWHREMAGYLRAIDPYRHLISTSFGGDGLNPALFELKNIDYSVAHVYNAPDESNAVDQVLSRLKSIGKPAFIEECGADSAGARADEDPQGLQLHNSLWASIASGVSAGSMLWWWDSLIDPKNLYPQLAVAHDFLSGIDWGREMFHPAGAELRFTKKVIGSPLRDLDIEEAPSSWSASPENRPVQVSVDEAGASGRPMAALLQGVGNHPTLHNPVTFTTNLKTPSVLDVRVGKVSGYGGAALRVSLDGKSVIDESFKDPDGSKGNADLVQFAGVRKCVIPAGQHQIVVENLGQDWVEVQYTFEKILAPNLPPLKAWASAGKTHALVWIRLADHTWRRSIERKLLPAPCPPTQLSLSGLTPGIWRAEVWDPWSGKIIAHSSARAVSDSATIGLPTIETDIAVRLSRE